MKTDAKEDIYLLPVGPSEADCKVSRSDQVRRNARTKFAICDGSLPHSTANVPFSRLKCISGTVLGVLWPVRRCSTDVNLSERGSNEETRRVTLSKVQAERLMKLDGGAKRRLQSSHK